MTNHDPESSWTPTLSTVNPMYRSFSCSTHETTVPERSRTTADEMCPLYSAPKKHTSQVMSLDGITHLKASHFVRTKLKHHTFIPKESDCNFSASGALLVLSVLAILLSGTVILLCLLLSRGVISLAVYPIATTGSDSSCQCEGLSSPISLLYFEEDLDNIQHQISLLQSKIPVSTSEAVKKVEQLLLETDSMEKTLSAHQVPVLETSGLSYPVQITIDDSNSGCTQEVEELKFTNYRLASLPVTFSYMNETHIVTDVLCTLEWDKQTPVQGAADVFRNSPQLSTTMFNFWSIAQFVCECIYWGNTPIPKSFVCRQTVTWCPSTSQSFGIFVKNLS